MQPVLNWWYGLSGREQGLLAVMGVLIAGLVLTYGIVFPLLAWQDSSRETLRLAQRDTMLVEDAARTAQQYASAQDARPAIRTVSLRRALGETTNARGIRISRLQPDPSGGLTIWADKIEATTFFAWLDELYETYGISAMRVSLQTNDDNDTVRAQVMLRDGSGT